MQLDRTIPARFLETAYRDDDLIAIAYRRLSQEPGSSDTVDKPAAPKWHHRFVTAGRARASNYLAWLRHLNANCNDIYVAWNQVVVFFFSPDASSIRSREKEKDMTERDVRWAQYPIVAQTAPARVWLVLQADRNLAAHTIETYGRSLEDFLRFMAKEAIEPAGATRAQVAGYLRDLTSRANPRQPNVILLESRAGLSNATILLRLSVVRLFYDHLVADGVRPTNPVDRAYGRKQFGRRAGEAPLFRRSRRLPWIPTEEQWRALLAIVLRESVRNRLMFALSYDAALRRQELLGLETTDLDPAHRLARVRAEHAKNGCERVVPYSPATGQLLALYLDERRVLSRNRGRLFLSASRRNGGDALSVWAWSKIVKDVARVSGVVRFTTHTLRHLCLTDLARAGWDIHEIAAFAGHRSLASTLLYIHLSGRELSSKLAVTMSHLHARRAQQLGEVRA